MNHEELSDLEEIKKLKAKYFRFMDGKQWADLGSLFADEGVLDVREAFFARHPLTDEIQDNGLHGSTPPVLPIATGPAQVTVFARQALAAAVSFHEGFMPEIQLLSASSARGIWAMEDRLWFPPGDKVDSLHGWGHYHDDYVRVSGRWLIQHSRLTRLRVDVT